jgi:hypothetical protein
VEDTGNSSKHLKKEEAMENFMGDLIPILAIIFSFAIPGTVIIIIAVLRHRQRIEFIRQGINPDQGIPQYPKQKPLLWGVLLLGLGIAGIASSIWRGDAGLTRFGFLFSGAGIALLVYWRLTAPDRERARRLFEERYAAGAAETRTPARRAYAEPTVSVKETETPGGAE